MRRTGSAILLLLLASSIATCANAAQTQMATGAKVGRTVAAQLTQAGKANVVVALKSTAQRAGETGPQRAQRVSSASDAVLSALPAGSFRIRHRFANVDALAMDVTA